MSALLAVLPGDVHSDYDAMDRSLASSQSTTLEIRGGAATGLTKLSVGA